MAFLELVQAFVSKNYKKKMLFLRIVILSLNKRLKVIIEKSIKWRQTLHQLS
jgi:hypothetical protein